MSDNDLKAENTSFKEWYIKGRHLNAGKWSFAAIDILSGLRFAVIVDRKLQEVWRKGGKGYERVI